MGHRMWVGVGVCKVKSGAHMKGRRMAGDGLWSCTVVIF